MKNYNDNSIGPIGAADAGLLSAIAKYYNAPRVLEIGSQNGDSARCWLDAGCCRLVCVDAILTQGLMDEIGQEIQCTFHHCFQQDFKTEEMFDIIFLDASHDPQINAATVVNLQGNLRKGGVLVIHDTGLWAHDHMTDAHKSFSGGCDFPEGYAHQPGEIVFVGWLKNNGWHCVSLASKTALRHGITICQRP
jgi:predicted O-methyltransferase YrrM